MKFTLEMQVKFLFGASKINFKQKTNSNNKKYSAKKQEKINFMAIFLFMVIASNLKINYYMFIFHIICL